MTDEDSDHRMSAVPSTKAAGTNRYSGYVPDLLRLGRFHFIPGGFILFCAGALLAVADGASFHLFRFSLGYSVLFCAHLSVSYSNDYFDVEADRHNSPTPFSGGSGVLTRRPELMPWAKAIACGLISASLVLAAVFQMLFGPPPGFLLIVLTGNAVGWYYSAPPLRLAYRGLGESAMMVTTGFLVPGFGYFVLNGGLGGEFILWALPMLLYGLLSTIAW